MWEHRNDKLHGETLTPTQATELDTLRQQVRAEFSKGPITLLPNHKSWLNDKCKEWALTQTYPRTQRWIETIQLSRKGYQIQQTKLNTTLTRQQQRLRQWLATATPPQVQR
jgi:hypothetical protein